MARGIKTARTAASVIFEMEADVHKAVALAEAVRIMGFSAPGIELNSAAVHAVGEAAVAAAERVRAQWEEACRLSHLGREA
jgi:hypothetical protein